MIPLKNPDKKSIKSLVNKNFDSIATGKEFVLYNTNKVKLIE